MVQIQLETNAWNLLGQETGRIVRNFF
jgi:hypothetical protein